MDFVLFCIGAVSVLGQVVLFREWMVAAYGAEIVCVLALGIWMLMNALGVFMAASDRGPRLPVSLAMVGVGFLADMVFIRSLRKLTGVPPGTYLPLGVFIPAVIISLVPVCLFLGGAFQRAVDYGRGHGQTHGRLHGRSLARAYTVECAGSVCGGVLSAGLLSAGVQNLAQAVICSAIAMMAAAVSTRAMLSGADRFRWATVFRWIPAGVLLLAFLMVGDRVDDALTRWNHPDLVESVDSEYGRLTVTQRAGQTVLYQNDVLTADSQSVSAEELVHPACLQHPAPRNVLILEGFAERLAEEAARHGPARIDQVEIDPALVRLARRYLTADAGEPEPAIDIRTHITDPRQYLRSGRMFDVIISGCAEPSTALSNRFFTRTFFRWCRQRLNPGGILAFRLVSSENFWSPPLAYRNASVMAALKEEFPQVLVIPGSVDGVLASLSPLETDPQVLIDRYHARNLKTRLVTPPYIAYILSNDRRETIDRMLASQYAPPNTDDQPVCYTLTGWIWLSRLIPELTHQPVAEWISAARRYGWGVSIVLILACGVVMNRLSTKGRHMAFAAAGFAGFGAMVLESAMMLHYQTQSGALYQNMGILFMAFMLGMSVGAAVMINLMNRFRNLFCYGFVDALLFFLQAGVCLGWAGIQSMNDAPGLVPMAFLLAAAGFGVSAIFTRYAQESEHPRSLYAADVIGGGIGALICGILLFPLLGLNQSVFLLAGMCVAAGIGAMMPKHRFH